jgi:diguanylate cyclase (GGDEF)-like protein
LALLSKEKRFDLLSRLSRMTDLDMLLDLLGTEIELLGIADGYMINLLQADGAHLVSHKVRFMAEFHSLQHTYVGQKYLTGDEHINALAFQTRAKVRIDSRNAPEQEANILRYWKCREIVAVPITLGEHDPKSPLGTVMLLKQGDPIPEAQFEPLAELLAFFHASLSHWMRYAYFEEMHHEAMTAAVENNRLLQFLDEMNSLTSVEKIYELFAAELFRQMPFDFAIFSLAENGNLDSLYAVANDEQYRPIGLELQRFIQANPVPNSPTASGAAYVFQRDETRMFPDLQEMMHLPIPEHDLKIAAILKTPRTLFISPIRYKKAPIGIFAFYSLTRTLQLSDADLHLLEHLSSFLGTAITNCKIYATTQAQNVEIGLLNEKLQEKVVKLAEQASTDQLTGLFNFRVFQEQLTKRLMESQRTSDKKDLSLLLIDIDYFKKFNDTYGHAAGNDVLAGVALDISKLIRQTDMACRYGGEEFSVILPKCDTAGAQLMAERIRSALAAHQFSTCAGVHSVTVSIGCTTSRPNDTLETFFGRVDQALYRAKSGGRNQVCIA